MNGTYLVPWWQTDSTVAPIIPIYIIWPPYFLDPIFSLPCSPHSTVDTLLSFLFFRQGRLLPQDFCAGCSFFLNCTFYIPMTNFLACFKSSLKSHLVEATLTTPFKTSTYPLPLALPYPNCPDAALLPPPTPYHLVGNSLKDFEMDKNVLSNTPL